LVVLEGVKTMLYYLKIIWRVIARYFRNGATHRGLAFNSYVNTTNATYYQPLPQKQLTRVPWGLRQLLLVRS
jgi:hypothetical protein